MEKTEKTLGFRELFWIFFKAGLAFGGGLGILAVLEDELVSRRKVVSKEEFLANYALGRIVPSGTMTALAIAYGYKFKGWLGTVVTLVGLALPAFIITVGLTAAYVFLKGSQFLELLPYTLLPAALAFIIIAAVKLGKDVFKPSLELVIAGLAFGLAFFLNFNPALLLLGGGILGSFVFKEQTKPATATKSKVQPEGEAKK